MNAKVEQILRKQAYDFAIMIGKSEAEAQAEVDNKIKSVNKLAEREQKQKWVDITTGKKHTPQNPY
jgi:L-rhamnose mutarotase